MSILKWPLVKWPLVLYLLLLLYTPFSSSVLAQTTTGVLEGTAADTTGAVLQDATVQVKGDTTDRTVVTDSRGFYRVAALPAGLYSLTASLGGFQTIVLKDIVLPVDRTVVLDVRMDIASRAEAVTVVAAVPSLDITTSSTSAIVDARTIDSIPLNGRNYLDLMLLLPGVAVNEAAPSSLSSRDTRGSVFGERAGNTAFLIDGVENTDDFHGGVFQAFTQDAVQEFEVIEAGYKAEFGRGSGGIVNVVTKNGGPALSGSGFFFLRNDALDASNVAGANPPALSRYNGGATIGGPVTTDRSWFFGSLEQVRERRQARFPPNIPDSLKASEDFSRNPETINYRTFGKYNRRVTPSQDFRGELSWTRLDLHNELASALALPSASTNNITNTVFGTVALTSIFSPQVLLESTFGVRGQNFGQNQQAALDRSFTLMLDDGSSFDFGPPIGSVQTLSQRYYTLREVLSTFRSRHSAKTGIELIRTTVDGVNGQGLVHVIATTRPLFLAYGKDSFQVPQGITFVNPGDDQTRLRNNGVSVFGQDDWRIATRLTLNLGLRYDYDSQFNDANNLAPRLGVVWTPDEKTVVRANWGLFYDRYRLGVAQAVPELGGFNGRINVEVDYPRLALDADRVRPAGSLGRLARTLGPAFLNTALGIPAGALVTANNVQSLTGMTPGQFLTRVNAFLAGVGLPFLPVDFSPWTGYLRQNLSANYRDQVTVARPFRTPSNNTVTVGVQRQLASSFSAGATYLHREIVNILGVRIPNLARASRDIGAPVTTDGGPVIRSYGPFYDGRYDGLILTADKRFGRRYQVQANYVYARSTDNLLNANLGLGIATQGGGALPTDNLDLEFDRGNSDLFVPHAFVASGVVSLPLNVWISGVFRATSGVYFSAAGATTIDYDGDGISSTRPRNTTRNQFRGPATTNVDLRVEKRFAIGRYTAAGLVEVFNLTNAGNPKLIDNSYQNGAPGPNFGAVKVPLPGREAQIGLRLRF